jgi:3-oxoadipate enol-lactonase
MGLGREVPLHCGEFGQHNKPVLVLLHGLGIAHRMCKPQFERLADRFHILAPVLPGFARSAGAGPFGLTAAAAMVAGLIRERSGRAAHVCGLSLGGLVAIQMALTGPEAVASLMLSAAQVRPRVVLMAFQQLLFAVMPERQVLESLATDLPTGDPGLLNAAREDARLTGKREMLQAMRAAARANFRPVLRGIQKPTVVLCGSKDWTNLPAARELARSLPHAELCIIAGAGHVWNIERPNEFAATLSQFVDRVS